jgi:hypothetical protein
MNVERIAILFCLQLLLLMFVVLAEDTLLPSNTYNASMNSPKISSQVGVYQILSLLLVGVVAEMLSLVLDELWLKEAGE